MQRVMHDKPGCTMTKVMQALQQRMVDHDNDLVHGKHAADDTAVTLHPLGKKLCQHVSPLVDFSNIKVMSWELINADGAGSFEVKYIDRNEPDTEHRILLEVPVRSVIQVRVEEPSGSWAEQLASSGLSSTLFASPGLSP